MKYSKKKKKREKERDEERQKEEEEERQKYWSKVYTNLFVEGRYVGRMFGMNPYSISNEEWHNQGINSDVVIQIHKPKTPSVSTTVSTMKIPLISLQIPFV